MNFNISENKKRALIDVLQTFLDQRLGEYKQFDDDGDLNYGVSSIISNLNKIEITDIDRTDGVWSIDLLFFVNRIFSFIDEDLIYDLSDGLSDYIGKNKINISQQESEYGI